jgi:hypothetical protein
LSILRAEGVTDLTLVHDDPTLSEEQTRYTLFFEEFIPQWGQPGPLAGWKATAAGWEGSDGRLLPADPYLMERLQIGDEVLPVTGEFFAKLCDRGIVSAGRRKEYGEALDWNILPEKQLDIADPWPEELKRSVRSIFAFPDMDILRRLLSEAMSWPELRLIVIHCSDLSLPPDIFDTVWAVNPGLRVWMANNLMGHPRVRSLPLGDQNRQWKGGSATLEPPVAILRTPPEDRPGGIFASWRWDTNTCRPIWFEACRQMIVQGRRSDISLFRYLSPEDYATEIRSCRAALCPPGNGYDTHRVWEALYMGIWPILENNQHTRALIQEYPTLPVLIVNTVEDLETLAVPPGLSPLHPMLLRSYWETMLSSYIHSPETSTSYTPVIPH